jgi:hypothetical protein
VISLVYVSRYAFEISSFPGSGCRRSVGTRLLGRTQGLALSFIMFFGLRLMQGGRAGSPRRASRLFLASSCCCHLNSFSIAAHPHQQQQQQQRHRHSRRDGVRVLLLPHLPSLPSLPSELLHRSFVVSLPYPASLMRHSSCCIGLLAKRAPSPCGRSCRIRVSLVPCHRVSQLLASVPFHSATPPRAPAAPWFVPRGRRQRAPRRAKNVPPHAFCKPCRRTPELWPALSGDSDLLVGWL